MSKFKVEKGVALSEIQRRMTSAIKHYKYPFHEMKEIGESFFVPDDGSGVDKIQRRLSAIAFQTGEKFTTQQKTEKGVNGVRVWKGTRQEVLEVQMKTPRLKRTG